MWPKQLNFWDANSSQFHYDDTTAQSFILQFLWVKKTLHYSETGTYVALTLRSYIISSFGTFLN